MCSSAAKLPGYFLSAGLEVHTSDLVLHRACFPLHIPHSVLVSAVLLLLKLGKEGRRSQDSMREYLVKADHAVSELLHCAGVGRRGFEGSMERHCEKVKRSRASIDLVACKGDLNCQHGHQEM